MCQRPSGSFQLSVFQTLQRRRGVPLAEGWHRPIVLHLHWLRWGRLASHKRMTHAIIADLTLSHLYVSKALFHPVLDVLCFPWHLPYQDVVGKSIWTSVLNSWHCNDFCYPPWSWSPNLALVTGALCSVQDCHLIKLYKVMFILGLENELWRLTEFQSLLCHLMNGWLWKSYLTSLSPHFFL